MDHMNLTLTVDRHVKKTVRITPGGDTALFYSNSAAEERCIGHLRMDADNCGKLWTSWWPHSAAQKHNGSRLSAESIANVRKLIAAKAPLIKLALELDELPIEEEDDKLTFTWLPITAPHEMVEATAQLLAAILKLVKRLKRVTVVERETDNPRYTFRCFLLRLGFIGDEYRTTRKYLMKGMPGNGSQRHMAVEDEESVQDNAQDEPIEVERIEKLETQTDVVTEEELAALPADEADAPADDSGALPAENAPAENAPAGESAE